MKLLLLSALAGIATAEVRASWDTLIKNSRVVYSEEACGEWDEYICCASNTECKDLKKGGADKKTEKKNEKDRKAYCVHNTETCCGSDITWNWKHQRKNGADEAIDHDHKKKKNVKGCSTAKDEVCVAKDVLSHSMSDKKVGDHDEDFKFAIKETIGKKSKTTCMKKDKIEKKKAKINKKYNKKVDKETKHAEKEFVDMVSLAGLQDQHHQCGNFDKKVFKCCSPDKNFCDQISADDKNKWCVHKKDKCCMDFTYSPADRGSIKLDYDDADEDTWAMSTACKKDDDEVCVYDTHDPKDNIVTTKCVDKKEAKKNKKRGKYKKNKKKKDSGSGGILDLLGGGQSSLFGR